MENELQRQAKQPVTRAAGPYGHPFHPIFVTLPIGAWTVSLVFDVLSHAIHNPTLFVHGAFWCIGIGIVGALLAAIFGLLDLLAVPRGTKAFRTGITHMVLNLGVTGAYVASLLLRRGHLDATSTPVSLIVLSVVAMGLLGASGWLGGKLAYSYGVRVADELIQAKGFDRRDVTHA